MDLGLKGKGALVAASSKGLGLASATTLAAEGARVVMSARNEADLDAAVEAVRAETGGDVRAIPADVTKPEDIERLVSQAREELGAIDILVTNTGAPPLGGFADLTDEQWRDTFELLTLSLIRLLRLVTPEMRERKWGRVISIQSVSVKQPLAYLVLSNGVRPGAAGVLKSLVDELAKDNVTINAVLPGTFLTERLRTNFTRAAERLGKTFDEQLAESAGRVPMGRLGEPQELGALVAFLASEAAAYITGTAIQIDGGSVRALA
jgi:3-oxoacyl-[acyl-carrier protein] reductase